MRVSRRRHRTDPHGPPRAGRGRTERSEGGAADRPERHLEPDGPGRRQRPHHLNLRANRSTSHVKGTQRVQHPDRDDTTGSVVHAAVAGLPVLLGGFVDQTAEDVQPVTLYLSSWNSWFIS